MIQEATDGWIGFSKLLLDTNLLLGNVKRTCAFTRFHDKLLAEDAHLLLLSLQCGICKDALYLHTIPCWNEMCSDDEETRYANHDTPFGERTALQVLDHMHESLFRPLPG